MGRDLCNTHNSDHSFFKRVGNIVMGYKILFWIVVIFVAAWLGLNVW